MKDQSYAAMTEHAHVDGVYPFPVAMQTRTIETNGTSIHVRVGGHGPAVVMLHGFGTTGDMWGHLANALIEDHMIVAPDLRGLGLSSKPNGGYDKKNQAADVLGVLDALGVRTAKLVTHDIGIMVGFAVAATHRERVSQWVAIDAPLPGVGPWDQITQDPAMWHFGFGGQDMERLVAGRERIYLDRFWNELSRDQKRFDEAKRQHYAALYAQPGAMRAGFAQFLAFSQDATDNRAFLAQGKLQMPVLALGGEATFGPMMGTVIRCVADNVEDVIIPDCGHWITEEQPAATTKLVVDFLHRRSWVSWSYAVKSDDEEITAMKDQNYAATKTTQVRLTRRSPEYWRVTIDHPPLNIFGPEMLPQVNEIIQAIETDEQVKVVVFDSAVEGFFLIHLDFLAKLDDLAHLPPGPTGLHPWNEMLVRLSRAPVVSIASIRGRATGMGSELALACDMRFASREKAILSQFEVGAGLVPGGGPMARLSRLMGRGRALEVILSADDVSGDLAERYGYVNRSLPDSDLDAFVDALATRIGSFDKQTIMDTKRLINVASLPPDIEIESGWNACIASMARPATQQRIKTLIERGFCKPGDAENRLGDFVGR